MRKLLLPAVLLSALLVGIVGVAVWKRPAAPAATTAPDARAAAVQGAETPVPAGVGAGARQAGGVSTAASKVQAFEALKARANAGDAVSQRSLAQAYEVCSLFNMDRQPLMRMIRPNGARPEDAENLAALERATRARQVECDAVDGGAAVPEARYIGWYEQAARNGDLSAQLYLHSHHNTKLDAGASARLLETVLASHDAEAVMMMGSLVGEDSSITWGEPYAALTTGPHAEAAWQIAGCRMGYDCDAGSMPMDLLCVMLLGCNVPNFEAYARGNLGSDAERAALDRQVEAVLGLVEGR